jgi:hypothetical protein
MAGIPQQCREVVNGDAQHCWPPGGFEHCVTSPRM